MPIMKLNHDGHQFAIDSQGQYESVSLTFKVFECSSEVEALEFAMETVNKKYNDLNFSGITLDEILNETTYVITVSYAQSDMIFPTLGFTQDKDDTTSNFDCSGTTVHCENALDQKKVKGDTKFDVGKKIGWNGKVGDEAQYSGCDMYEAHSTKAIVKVLLIEELSIAYERRIASMVGKVNKGGFEGYQAGEVLFLGASWGGQNRKREKISVSYNFAIKFNESITLSETPISKKGWQLVWEASKPNSEGKINILGIWVSDIYEEVDFGALKI